MDTMKDTTMQPATDAVINELRMLAEDLYVNGYNRYSSAMSQAADKLEALRAKIERMEKQAPTHWSCNVLQADASWKEEVGREIPPDGYYSIRDIKPLYALPGAQTQGEEK